MAVKDDFYINGKIVAATGLRDKALVSADLLSTDSDGNLQVASTDPLGVGAIQFDTAHTPLTNAEGLLQWNTTDGTLDLGMSGGDITMQLGQELFQKVRNVSGSTILNASPVYVSGRTGNRPNIYLCRSDSHTTSGVIGLTTQDIASPADGFITTFGYVRGIKTDYTGTGDWGTTWASGDRLYISKTVAGQLTNVEPSAPHHSDVVATVEVVHQNLGSLLVNINQHKTFEELTDVNGTALTTTGQFPVWNQTAGYFDFNFNIGNYAKLDGTNHPFTFVKTPNIRPNADSTTAVQITKADGTTIVLNVDTTNSRVGVGTTTPATLFFVNGSYGSAITTVTDTYNILASDNTVICNKATAFTVTLPTAVVGQKFTIKNIGAGTVTVDGDSTDTIDGSLTQSLIQWESMQLQCYIANKWGVL